ncbi:MAG: glycoside hydrolase family 16 protein [Polyangiaceae bacterium]|jgi:beta-glucanase (GH16 family)
MTPSVLGRPDRALFVAGGAFLVGALAACSSKPPPAPDWQLSWSDEFTEGSLDATKWNVDTGDSFGTGQEDYDTPRPVNLSVSGGNLVLTARAESYQGASYTSARIETQGKFAQAYGRFEARIQIPAGQGLWPAFWLLGDDYASAGWPQCGELDIMEERGATPGTVLGSMHGPGGDSYTAAFSLGGDASFSDDFHVFALEWEPGVARWYVDGQLYETQSADMLPASQTWVFDHPFFVILDLAVGGSFGGPITSATPMPQSMLVDYVRVYTNGPNDAGVSDDAAGD